MRNTKQSRFVALIWPKSILRHDFLFLMLREPRLFE
jgi:hypothetical protein